MFTGEGEILQLYLHYLQQIKEISAQMCHPEHLCHPFTVNRLGKPKYYTGFFNTISSVSAKLSNCTGFCKNAWMPLFGVTARS